MVIFKPSEVHQSHYVYIDDESTGITVNLFAYETIPEYKKKVDNEIEQFKKKVIMGECELDKCDFCNEIKTVERTYLFPSKFKKPEGDERFKLYNEGTYFVIIKTCSDCGTPSNKRNKDEE